MKTSTRIVLLGVLFVLLLVGGGAGAAVISWSSAPAPVEGFKGVTLSENLFNTEGTLVLAENSGGPARTFDGIAFAAATGRFSSTAAVFHEGNQISVEGSYQSSTSGKGTVTLSSLSAQQDYRVQVLMFDGRSTSDSYGRTVEFDDLDMGQYASGVYNVTWGDGLLVTGTFTADATTQDFDIQVFLANGDKGGAQMNAMTLYAIPEPASLGLIGLMGSILLIRRRLYGIRK